MRTFVKGSPQALAWAKRMKAARIRAAGRRAETQFFGSGGEFADEAAAKGRTNPRRLSRREVLHLDPVPSRVKGKKFPYRGVLKAVEGSIPMFFKSIQEGRAHGKKFGYTVVMGRAKARKNPIIVVGNPKKKTVKGWQAAALINGKREVSDMFRTRVEGVAWLKNLQREGFVLGIPGVYPVGLMTRPTRRAERMRHNPPARINTGVAGVLYHRCIEIRAEKTQAKGLKGLYYHPFLERSKVCILALDNGDLLVHSTVGEKLWKLD